MRPCLALLALSSLILFVLAAPPTEADPEVSYAEKVLKAGDQSIDGDGLVKFFRGRTLTEEQQAKLKERIRDLGHADFPVREKASEDLVRAGRVARPLLVEAQKDPDAEIARRAEQCLEVLDKGTETTLCLAAARLMAHRKPTDAASVLVTYLPMTDDEAVIDAVFETLLVVGIRDNKPDPSLTKALSDRHPLRRAAAAHVLGQRAADQRDEVAKLLTDTEPRVRFRAANALARAGHKPAIVTLIGLLADGPLPLAWQSQDLLCVVAGDKAPVASLSDEPDVRKKCKDAWQTWWKDSEGKVDLAKLRLEGALQGLNLVCDCDVAGAKQGVVWEFGVDGKARWQIDGINAPVDVHLLPGGRVLIAEGHTSKVTERDRSGKVLWTHPMSGYTTTCRRLPDGNTLCASYSGIQVVAPDGKIVFNHATSCYRVQRLKNGNYVFAAGDHAMELTSEGKEVAKVRIPDGTGIWATVDKLGSGNYLVAQYSANRVVELTAEGKVVWEVKVTTPSSASRLPNGNTLVSSMDDRVVLEYDRTGKSVWKQATQGRPFLIRRY